MVFRLVLSTNYKYSVAKKLSNLVYKALLHTTTQPIMARVINKYVSIV